MKNLNLNFNTGVYSSVGVSFGHTVFVECGPSLGASILHETRATAILSLEFWQATLAHIPNCGPSLGAAILHESQPF